MRVHAAPIGLALLLLTVAVSGCGSGTARAHAQAETISINYTTSQDETRSPVPTDLPASDPTSAPSPSPTRVVPTRVPTSTPTETPTRVPTATPVPTSLPTQAPTETPSQAPTLAPTDIPAPTAQPTEVLVQPTVALGADGRPQPPDRLVAPSIGLDTQITPVGWHSTALADGSTELDWDVASYVAGWHKTSARPGEIGNIVLAGHSDILGEVFQHLGDLNIGDTITLYAGGRTFDYVVNDKFVVQETGATWEQRVDNGKWIGQFPDARLTIFTCWPPNNNTHRIFIIARPAPGS